MINKSKVTNINEWPRKFKIYPMEEILKQRKKKRQEDYEKFQQRIAKILEKDNND